MRGPDSAHIDALYLLAARYGHPGLLEERELTATRSPPAPRRPGPAGQRLVRFPLPRPGPPGGGRSGGGRRVRGRPRSRRPHGLAERRTGGTAGPSPPPGRGRRVRKVYRITDAGRRCSSSCWPGGRADDARSFGLRLAFARHLAPQARLALLERRRAQLLQRLAEVRAATGAATRRLRPLGGGAHRRRGAEQDVRWLDRLIEAERPGGDRRPTAGRVGRPDRRRAGRRSRAEPSGSASQRRRPCNREQCPSPTTQPRRRRPR